VLELLFERGMALIEELPEQGQRTLAGGKPGIQRGRAEPRLELVRGGGVSGGIRHGRGS